MINCLRPSKSCGRVREVPSAAVKMKRDGLETLMNGNALRLLASDESRHVAASLPRGALLVLCGSLQGWLLSSVSIVTIELGTLVCESILGPSLCKSQSEMFLAYLN